MPTVNNSDDVKVHKTQVTVFLTAGIMSHSRDKHSWVWFLSFQSFSSWQYHAHTAPHPDILSLCMCVSAIQQGAAEGVSFLPSFLPAVTAPSTMAPMTCFLLCTELLALLTAPLLVQSCTYWRILWFFQVFVTFHSSEWNMDSFKWTKWRVLLINDRYSKRGKRPCIHSPANSAHVYDQYLISPNLVSKNRVQFKLLFLRLKRGSRWLGGKEPAANAAGTGEAGSTPGSGRSPGGGDDNPLQYSCLEKFHGQKSLVGCRPWGCRVRHTQHARKHASY